MLDEVLLTVQEWLLWFKTTLHNITLLQLLEVMLMTLIASGLLLYLSKALNYFLKYTLELAKTLLKVASILTVIIFVLLILRALFDPTRTCRFNFESYITRCKPAGVGFIPPESQ